MIYRKPPPDKVDQSMYFELSQSERIMFDFKCYKDQGWTKEQIKEKWIEENSLLIKVLYNIVLGQLYDYLPDLKKTTRN